jgi:hypothetical protein
MYPLGKKPTLRIVLGVKPSRSNYTKLGQKPVRQPIGRKKPASTI